MSDVVLRARARAGRVPPVEASPRGPLASGRGRDGPATYRGAPDGAPRWTPGSALRGSAGAFGGTMSCPRRPVVECSAPVPESRRDDQYAEVGNRSASYNVTTSPDRLPYPIRVRIVRDALQGRRPLRSVRQGSISTCPSLGSVPRPLSSPVSRVHCAGYGAGPFGSSRVGSNARPDSDRGRAGVFHRADRANGRTVRIRGNRSQRQLLRPVGREGRG